MDIPTAPMAPDVQILAADTPGALSQARQLMTEYGASVGHDLSFQDFAKELAGLPGPYSPPGGCLLLAHVRSLAAGCACLRPLEAEIAELKRMYVRPAYRRMKVGETLALAILERAKALGYRRMRLDTLAEMDAAVGLYTRLGFKRIPAYYNNPLPGAIYLERSL